MMRPRTQLLLALVLCVAPEVLAAFDPNNLNAKYAIGASYHTMGWTGSEMRNVDDSAGDELLIGYTSMFHVLRWDSRSSDFVQVGFFEDYYGSIFGQNNTLNSVAFARFDPSAPYQVAVLNAAGNVGRFSLSGALAEPLWTPPVRAEFMRVADLDQTPGDELLLATCSELTAWKYGAQAPLWRVPVASCQSVLIAQLDSDSQLELVLGSGSVIDTKTLQVEWRYPIGFGIFLVSGDVNRDGVPDLVGCAGRQCDAFDVLRRTTIWEVFLPYPAEVGGLAAADVDGDGTVEIFESDGQHGSVRKLDGATGIVLQEFSKAGGGNFVLVGDMRGDCSRQVVWAKDGDSTGFDTLHATNALTMQTFWSSVPEEKGASGVAIGDFAGTGQPAVLWSARGGSILRLADLKRGTRTAREIHWSYDGYATWNNVTAAAQLDSDAAFEYISPVIADVFAGLGGIGVYDGSTHRLEWSVDVAGRDTISALHTSDLNGDGFTDIIAGASILYFPASHPESVVAIDGKTRKQLWRTTADLSHLLDPGCGGCILQLEVADLNLDGSKEVLALVPSEGLHAFNGATGALLWTSKLAGPDDPTSFKAFAFATADIDPSPGVEIIVPLIDKRIAVFDSSATNILRSADLSRFGLPSAVKVADLDGDRGVEIALVTPSGLVVVSDKLDVLWSGGFLLPGYSHGNQIVIADVDGNGGIDIVVPSAHSLRVFEYLPLSDSAAPVFSNAMLRSVAPASGCCRVALEWDRADDVRAVVYRVYRSESPAFAISAANRIGESDTNMFTDRRQIFAGRTYHYAVTAVDRAGNESLPLRLAVFTQTPCVGEWKRNVRPK